MEKRKYSEKIFKQIIDFLESKKIQYHADEEDGDILYYASTLGDLNSKLKAIIYVKEDSVMCINYLEFGLDVDNPVEMAHISEFITRANWGLTYGCFSIDYKDGDILYTFTIDLDEMELSEAMTLDLIMIPLVMLHRYVPGLEKVKYVEMDPVEAIDICEADTLRS